MRSLFAIFSIVTTSIQVFSQDSVPSRIDTHIHLYDTRREGSSTFLDPVKHEKIYFPHFAKEFVDTAGPAGIDYAVVVEASKRREDNFWLMQHVDTSDALVAFIANLDPRDPNYLADLDFLSKYKKFRGIRIRPSTPIDISDPSIMAKFALLARKNLVLELGGNGVDPQTIAAIARRFPNMNIIMNHMAGGRIQGDQVLPSDWKERLAVFASEQNVYCKISALYTLSGKDPAPIDATFYKPLIDPVVDAFGPGRVIFGSNWTLSDMLGLYKDMIYMLDEYIAGREDLGPAQFYYENINMAYGINQAEIPYPGNGNGLFRSYWQGEVGGRGWFKDSICGVIVPHVDEYWASGSPDCEVNSTFWNARWEGFLEPVFSEDHTFYLTANDYARLWIDDQLVIDEWTGGSSGSCHKANVNLISNEKVPIRIDFANIYDEAFITLEWESSSQPKVVVPVNQLSVPINTGAIIPDLQKGQILIYPNPANDQLSISNNIETNYQISILGINGRIIHQQKVNGNKLEIDISAWERGLYFARIIYDNAIRIDKLVVE